MNELRPVLKEFVSQSATPDAGSEGNPDRFVNREFSWLQFNRRVLEESQNSRHPLLERVRFLSISAANLDEFFMVRVAGLAGQVREGIATKSPDGRTPEQQLEQLLLEVGRLQQDQQECFSGLMDLLSAEGIEIIQADALTKDELPWLEEHFMDSVFPVLTPLSIDPAHPFPFIPNLGFSIALRLQHLKNKHEMMALLRLPVALKRFIRLPDRKALVRFIPIEETVGLFIGKLFPGYEVQGSGTFRLIRDSDIEVEEEAEDLVRFFETALKRRRRGSVIRIEFDSGMPDVIRDFVAGELGVPGNRISMLKGPLAVSQISEIVVGAARRPQIQAVQPALSRAHPRPWRRLLRGDPREGHRRPPPLRILRRRGAVPAPGDGRSGSGGDQADALPHLQRQPDRARAGRRGRGRQIGDGAGRTEGALRRRGQHPLGARPRTRRRAGGVRLRRAEDPRQDVAGHAPRGRAPAQLRPSRHRQLSSDHRAHLYRPVVLHDRSVDRPRRRPDLQLHHRLCRAGRGDEAGAVALYAADPPARPYRRRDGICAARASRRASG